MEDKELKEIYPKFGKSLMRYSFENMGNGAYQVRLNGQFVCFTNTKDSAEVDKRLQDYGYISRGEFFEESLAESLRILRGE